MKHCNGCGKLVEEWSLNVQEDGLELCDRCENHQRNQNRWFDH